MSDGVPCRLCGHRAVQQHHIVYQQHIRRDGGNLSAKRNLRPVCWDCHERHHNRSAVIRVSQLLDTELDWAFTLMGPAAYDYFRRYYDPAGDTRLDGLLEQFSGRQVA